jgi:hypothetical protein
MPAATAAINTPEAHNDVLTELPVEANTNVYVGTMAALNAAGNAVPASDTAGLHVLGRCEGTPRTVDPNLVGSDGINNPGAAGAVQVNVRRGIFRWNNAAGGNAITAAMIGQPAYVYDDNTVGILGGTAHGVVAGTIFGLDSYGVWIDTRRLGAQIGIETLTSDSITDNSTGTAAAPAAGVRTIAAVNNVATAANAIADLAAEFNSLRTDVQTLASRLG